MNIRRPSEKELFEVYELSKEWEEEAISYGWRAEGPEEFKDKILFVAGEDEIIGFVYGELCENKGILYLPENVKYATVEGIYVKKEFRGKGIGKQLLNTFLEECKRQGARYVCLVIDNKEPESIAHFYKKFGFKVVRIDMIGTLESD